MIYFRGVREYTKNAKCEAYFKMCANLQTKIPTNTMYTLFTKINNEENTKALTFSHETWLKLNFILYALFPPT